MTDINPQNTPDQYYYTHHEITDDDSREFFEYNLDVFGVSVKQYEDAMRDLEINEDTIKTKIAELKSYLEERNAINKAKGNFGESTASYFLERKENFIFTRYGWSSDPFAGRTNIDLFAIDPTRKYIAYIEAKAALAKSYVKPAIKSLIEDQLLLENILSITKFGITTPQAISKAYYAKMSKMTTTDDPLEVIDTLFRDRFMRIGVILHQLENHHDHSDSLLILFKDEKKFKKKFPEYSHIDCFPTRLIDIKNPHIQEHFDRWILSAHVMTQV